MAKPEHSIFLYVTTIAKSRQFILGLIMRKSHRGLPNNEVISIRNWLENCPRSFDYELGNYPVIVSSIHGPLCNHLLLSDYVPALISQASIFALRIFILSYTMIYITVTRVTNSRLSRPTYGHWIPRGNFFIRNGTFMYVSWPTYRTREA